MSPSPLGLFAATGIELEYMLVDRETLAVRPAVDELLRAEAGSIVADVEFPDICWSNELVLHVVELKTNGPTPTLAGTAAAFQEHVRKLDALAETLGARLMPTAMHPFMDPLRETKLWPHESSPVYEAYDRIFGCRGHGWSNLQSMHINLPFANDDEFGRLHAAIRLVLPLLPALAASSPIADGARTSTLDTRLDYYRKNSSRIPSLTGDVIPEPVFTMESYRHEILERLYRDIAPHDPDEVLRGEFLNSRGAIARFDRNAFEIRVIDVQECPAADLAIAYATREVLRAFVDERLAPYADQRAVETDRLASVFLTVLAEGDRALVADPAYLRMVGGESALPAGEIWRSLLARALPESGAELDEHKPALDHILDHGCLARRISNALGSDAGPDDIRSVYTRLCDALLAGTLFP